MHKIIFGIFAHPDDEAFGPAATLIKEVRDGAELHLIMLTAGENGQNPDNVPNLGEVRMQEWRRAGEIIGAKSMNHLGYEDGTLCNKDHQEIAGKLEELVKNTLNGRADVEIELIALDLNGFTGHIDHIVASRSACLTFYRLRDAGLPMKRVRLYCWPESRQPKPDTGFVLMERGRKASEIDEIVEAQDYLVEINQVMDAHHTQRQDCEWIKSKCGDDIAVNHFMVKD